MKTMNWDIGNGCYGPRMVMKGPWSVEALRTAKSNRIRELELNWGKGWPRKGVNYSFLLELEDLEAIDIGTLGIDDVSAVNDLPNLRYLAVATYCKTALDFSRWPKLEECALEWRPKARSLFQHRGIKRLFINKWNLGNDLTDFSGMTQLESLRLYSPTRLETLHGIESLTQLTWLELALATRLTSLAGIEHLTMLQHLEIHTCRKIHDISPVAKLGKLREFFLPNCGEIESISPLAELKELEKFIFYETTNILDGDLSILERLPKLNDVAFMERSHYSYKRGDLPSCR